MRGVALAVMLALSTSAVATDNKCPGNSCKNSPQDLSQGQVQEQSLINTNKAISNSNSKAFSDSTSESSSVSSATGGNAVATGGNAVSEGSVAIAEAGAGGSVGDIEVSYVQARSAPSMGQGSFAISGCSVGGNAGGSNTSGSAFLGFGWTPLECYKFMLAQAYQAIGEKQAVCDILRKTKAGEALIKEGVELPTCEPEIVITANCNTEGCAEAAKAAAEAAMDERLDRMRKVWQENVK